VFSLRQKKHEPPPLRRAAPARPATPGEAGLPDVPSLEGYTIAELRTEQLARLIKFEELPPAQVAQLIRTLTRGHG